MSGQGLCLSLPHNLSSVLILACSLAVSGTISVILGVFIWCKKKKSQEKKSGTVAYNTEAGVKAEGRDDRAREVEELPAASQRIVTVERECDATTPDLQESISEENIYADMDDE